MARTASICRETSLRSPALGVSSRCQRLMVWPRHRYGRHRENSAIRAADEVVGSEVCPHPDAVRRREEALRRRRHVKKSRLPITALPSPPNLWNVTSRPDGVKALSTAELHDGLTVLFFSAPHCPACKALGPKLRQIASNNADGVQFINFDVADDELRDWVADMLRVPKLPYFILMRGGIVVSSFTANLHKVDVLRAEIAAHKPCTDTLCMTN